MVRRKWFLQSSVMSIAIIGMMDAIMDINFFVSTIIAILVITAIGSCIDENKTTLGVVMVIGIVLSIGALILWKWTLIGIKDYWNHIAKVIGIRFKMWIPIWTITESKIICISTQAVIGIFIAMLSVCTVRFINRFFVIAWMSLASMIQILFGNSISAIYFCILFISCLWRFGYGLEKEKRKLSVGSFGLLIVVMVVSCIFTACLPQKNANSSFINIQKNLIKSIENIYYGKNLSGLLEGDFTNVTGRKVEEGTALKITMQKPSSMYLRGFVGERFLDNQWLENDGKKQYEFANLFYWLHKENFYTQGQLKKAFDAASIEKKNYNISITPKYASRKYRYLPYEYCYTDDGNIQKKTISDGTIYNQGKSEYRYQVSPGLITDYPRVLDGLLQDNLSKEYREQEKNYNHYVYETYVDLDDEEKTIIQKSLGTYQLKNETHYSYEKAKENILNYLSKNIKYNEETSSKEKEFLNEFLSVKKEGYDIHYATAATLMFRYYKIPARYVEGYLITPSDVKKMTKDKAYNLPLANAHAWVEYYQDGVGWIPFEVTPPYVGVMDKAKILTKPSSTNIKKPQTQQKKIQKEKKHLIHQTVEYHFNKILHILPAFFFGLLSAIIWVYIYRAISIVKKRRNGFKQEDNAKATIALYSYMMEMLFSHGLVRKNKSLEVYKEEIDSYEIGYEEMLNLYRRARFSSKACDIKEREMMEKYMRKVNKKVYHSLKWYQKIKWRLWEFME